MMTTMITASWHRTQALLWRRAVGLSLATWVFVACAALGVIGLLWDGAWHASWGRDTFFIPPHNMMYASVTLAIGLALAIIASGMARPPDPTFFRVGRLQAPLGVWIVLFGAYTMLAAAPFDDWYHRAFGLDNETGLWSPPHFLGAFGGLVGVIGMLLFLLRESEPPALVDGKPRGLRGLSANNAAGLVMFSFVTFILGGLTMNLYALRHWYRTEGTLYPFLALLFGTATLVLAQRLTRRAGAATAVIALLFAIVGVVGAILSAAGYPVVISIPMMGLPSALLLDLFYARFGGGYRWLLLAGPLAAVAFYVSEYYWAGLLNGAYWPIEGALLSMPFGVVAGTVSLLFGAWLAARMEGLILAR
jgi:hypothetical protein